MTISSDTKKHNGHNCLLTILEGTECFLHLLSCLSLLGDLLSKELTGGNALPAKLVGDEGGVLLSETAWWTHEEDALH